ncbi:MAG: DNA recombination protein RmuC, partial [Halobacteria archaeon]|nr:DNA recombination protein RmuC [Halobacteria archaeon]
MKEILANPELISLLVAAVLIGALVVYLMLQRRISTLRDENTQLHTTLELERRNHVEKLETLERAREQLADTFSALSSQALKHNSEEFLKLAQENLKHFHTHASSELEKKEKAIEHLVGPIREA